MKLHLLNSESPLIEGENYSAICGKEISKASFVFRFEAEEFEFESASNLLFLPAMRSGGSSS